MSDKKKLHDHRREYDKNIIHEHSMPKDPLLLFHDWLEEAIKLIHEDATAMVLSTVASNKQPSSRIVLLKEIDDEGLTFFSNYESRKGKELQQNDLASVLFYWKEMERQVRIEGKLRKTSSAVSDTYFDSRPKDSRIAAIISRQSAVIKGRSELDAAFNAYKKKNSKSKLIRPDHWGGYQLIPEYFEFWQGRPNRLHDRFIYVLENEMWTTKRLAP